MSDDTTKQCTKCKNVYPLSREYFPINLKLKCGFDSWCKKCHSRASVLTAQKNPERRKAWREQWQANNRERIYQTGKEYREKHREKINDYNRQYYHKTFEKNRDRRNAYNRKWASKNKEKIAANHRRYHQANREQRALKGRTWRLRNPHKVRLYKEQRRTKIKGLLYTLTPQEWEDIKATYGYACAYCRRGWFEIEGVLEQDHVWPLSRGGAYTKENIVPACKSCNASKGNKTLEEWGGPIL